MDRIFGVLARQGAHSCRSITPGRCFAVGSSSARTAHAGTFRMPALPIPTPLSESLLGTLRGGAVQGGDLLRVEVHLVLCDASPPELDVLHTMVAVGGLSGWRSELVVEHDACPHAPWRSCHEHISNL